MKVLLSMLGHHIISEKTNWKIYAAFLLGITLCAFPVVSNYINLSRALGYEIQALEPYIIAMSTSYQFVAIFLGLFLLIADAPFQNERSAYEMLRVGKKRWFAERILYVNIMCCIYLFVMLLSCVSLSCIKGNVLWENRWSETMILLAERQPQFAVTQFHLAFPYPELLKALSPFGATVYSFILSLLYGEMLGMVAMFFNSVVKWRMGIAMALFIHIVGYVINMNGPIVFPQQWSLLSCALLTYYYSDFYNMDSFISITLYICVWLAIWYCIRLLSSRFELR